MDEFHGVVVLNFLLRGSVGGRQFLLVDANSAREKFSSGTEMEVGSLWWLAVYFSWRYILVGWFNLGLLLNRSCGQEQLIFKCHKLIVALCTTSSFTFEYNYIDLLPSNTGPQVISIIQYQL
jgi:hypothetical protein